MNKIIVIILIFIQQTNVIAQDSLQFLYQIPLKDVQHFSFDNKGFLFAVDNKSNVFKYDSLGKEMFHFSPKRPSEPKSFCANITSQILVFSQERQEFFVLDWLLSPIDIQRFDVTEYGYVSIVGQSAMNMLWIIDNVNFTLIKYNNKTATKIVETNLEFIIQNELKPLYIKEYDNFLYISTEGNGILVFDNLGNYKKKLPFNNINFFDFKNGEIYWNDNGEIYFLNLLDFSENRIDYNIKGKLKIIDEKLYFLTKDKIEVYRTSVF